MTDINQAILISAITVITVLLTIIGIQVALIFREFRRTVEKINKILDDAGNISGSVAKSFNELSSAAASVKTAFSLFRFFKRSKKKKEQKDE